MLIIQFVGNFGFFIGSIGWDLLVTWTVRFRPGKTDARGIIKLAAMPHSTVAWTV